MAFAAIDNCSLEPLSLLGFPNWWTPSVTLVFTSCVFSTRNQRATIWLPWDIVDLGRQGNYLILFLYLSVFRIRSILVTSRCDCGRFTSFGGVGEANPELLIHLMHFTPLWWFVYVCVCVCSKGLIFGQWEPFRLAMHHSVITVILTASLL